MNIQALILTLILICYGTNYDREMLLSLKNLIVNFSVKFKYLFFQSILIDFVIFLTFTRFDLKQYLLHFTMILYPLEI